MALLTGFENSIAKRVIDTLIVSTDHVSIADLLTASKVEDEIVV